MRARYRHRAGLPLWLGLGLGAALGACSGSDTEVLEEVGALAKAAIGQPNAAEATPQPSRSELNEIPSAVIAVTSEGAPRAFLVPLSDNSGYLNYRDAAGNAVVLLGGALARTESLGQDLQGVRHDRLDPIAHPTPLTDWPGRIWRDYQFAHRDLGRYRITLDCFYVSVARETIEIIEVRYDLFRVSEICTDAHRQITNTYWVEEASGFIWKSEQWAGPDIGQLTIEIIRPYAP